MDGNYDVVDAVTRDTPSAPVSAKLKTLLAIAGMVQQNGRLVTSDDVDRAKAEGATDIEIHDAVLIAAAFSMANRYVDGLATLTPTDPAAYDAMDGVWRRRGMPGPQADRSCTFLPDVETKQQDGTYRMLIEAARARGDDYSHIWDLFAFQNDVMVHLSRLTEGIIRKPARSASACASSSRPIPHLNEWLLHRGPRSRRGRASAMTSCGCASRRGQLSTRTRRRRSCALARRGVTTHPLAVTGEDVAMLRAAGWDDEAIYFAISSCALFNFYNRWISACGVPRMSKDVHFEQGGAWRSTATTATDQQRLTSRFRTTCQASGGLRHSARRRPSH